MKRICVFCGSQDGRDGGYREAARAFGAALARRGLGLVYGGGGTGLMGAVADAVLEHGGEVDGVIPGALVERELAHQGVTRLHVVDSMHERKATMAALADGFVALPGGMGTLEELTETLTWLQLGIHALPCGLLDVRGYWRGLLGALDHFVAEGFLRPEHRALLLVHERPEALLDALADWRAPPLRRWLDETRT